MFDRFFNAVKSFFKSEPLRVQFEEMVLQEAADEAKAAVKKVNDQITDSVTQARAAVEPVVAEVKAEVGKVEVQVKEAVKKVAPKAKAAAKKVKEEVVKVEEAVEVAVKKARKPRTPKVK